MPDPDLNLLGPDPGPGTPALTSQAPVTFRDPADSKATRTAIYDHIFDAASKLPPVSNKLHTLALKDVRWQDPGTISKKQHKEAVLTGQTLGRRLQGTWELSDNATGKVLDRRQQVILKAPHLTDDGTFVYHGNDYSISNQQRLKAGIFARVKDNGEIESHVNVLKGGPSHRYQLDPAKGQFTISVGQASIPLLPLLQHLGAKPDEIRKAWGDEIYARNSTKADGMATSKLATKFLDNKIPEGMNVSEALQQKFAGMTLDPEVTSRTLGHPHATLGKDAILAATHKLLKVQRGEADPDDRDDLAYHTFVGPEDLLAERISKDRAGARRQLLFKASFKGNLQSMPSSALQHQLDSALLESGLGSPLEEVNGLEILDKNTRVTRLGEGGIPDTRAITDESRSVQSSQHGFIDPLRTPESGSVGVDVFLASNARKGSDGKLYGAFQDVKTGKTEYRTPQQMSDAVTTFPGAMNQPGPRVPAIKGGRIIRAKRSEVQYVLPHMEHGFSALDNMVPFKSMLQGQRGSMASRMITQALALENPEAPLVQSAVPGTQGQRSYDEEYSKHAGAVHADQAGTVVASRPDALTVRYNDGRLDTVDLHQMRPLNRKSFMHQDPVLQAGDRFQPGQLLAKSNYTDNKGVTALGINARVAFVPWNGKNHEDAISISESMAKRLSSIHAYQHQLPVSERTRTGLKPYVSLFPSKYDRKTLANFGDNGVIKPGTKVGYGDPLILGAEERDSSTNKVHRKGASAFNDVSVTWEHHDPGEVTDVVHAKDGPMVVVKSVHPMQVADKLAGRHGNKGVVGEIILDSQMPHDSQGRPMEVLMNPLGVISRRNPSQVAETLLGKIARARGTPYKVEDFDTSVPDRMSWVRDELRKHGMTATEELTDPVRGTKIPNVLTGEQFLLKLHHSSESKAQGRGGGAYTAADEPAKGGPTGAKRISGLDVSALMSSGATEMLRDSGAVRGQRNDEYWLQFMQGHMPRDPQVPLVYKKYLADLQASGINVVRDGPRLHIMALTSKDIDKLAGDRVVRNGQTVRFGDDLKPVRGGLFDPEITGSHGGQNWSKIELPEPMLNPVMADPARRLLGLTQKQLEETIAGRHEIPGHGTGPKGLQSALESIDVDKATTLARAQSLAGSQTARDDAVRRLGYLKTATRTGVHPGEWIWNHAPVLPPQFRPVSRMGGAKQLPLVADSNFLYRELIEAGDNLKNMKQRVGEGGVGDERLAVYHALKAVAGLGEPISQASQEKNVKGVLKTVLGSSPKFSTLQRRLLSSSVDNVGRAVIAPDPDLDMDSVGLPEEKAFDVYERFIVRQLKRSGLPMADALQAVKDRTPLARSVLAQEMETRPVVVNRAPVLHRFGIMALRPKLVKGSGMKLSPLVYKGYGADNDGDAVQFHVPVSEEARTEALDRLLPSKMLISPADMKRPMHVASQEYTGGAYHLTAPGHATAKQERTFRAVADVRAAWLAGEIGANDPVRVLNR